MRRRDARDRDVAQEDVEGEPRRALETERRHDEDRVGGGDEHVLADVDRPEVHAVLWPEANVVALGPEVRVDPVVEEVAVDFPEVVHTEWYYPVVLSGGVPLESSGSHHPQHNLLFDGDSGLTIGNEYRIDTDRGSSRRRYRRAERGPGARRTRLRRRGLRGQRPLRRQGTERVLRVRGRTRAAGRTRLPVLSGVLLARHGYDGPDPGRRRLGGRQSGADLGDAHRLRG